MDTVSKPKSTIQQMLDDGKPRSEITQELVKLGFPEWEARFMLAMELGEIDGDIVALDAQGKRIKPFDR